MYPEKRCNLCNEMQQLSVVIICKNEADIIGKTLQSLDGLCDDVIVYDNGSTDDTIEQVKKFNVQLQQGTWEGFGKTKNKAIVLAKYDWVLSLDADEAIDEELKRSLLALKLAGGNDVYEIRFKNFLGNKYLKFGEWGSDKHIRLFNRKKTQWNDAPVHEELIMPAGTSVKKLNGFILHQTMKDMNDYAVKMVRYAMLNAEKYKRQGKRSSFFKIRIAPGLSFVHYFILKLGFLDGYAGYVCARMTSYYTFLKYTRLRELNRQSTMDNGQ